MSKAYLFAVMLLASGIIGCIDAAEDDNEELIEVLGMDDAYVTASKFIVDKFNDALYGAVCEKLMYEDGSFYSKSDTTKCLEEANYKYNSNESGDGKAAFFAPDWEYMSFENTGKQAALTGDIYRVSGVGFWCPERSNDKEGGGQCDGEQFTKLYMAKNTESGNWGYAAEGFRTSDGEYLEVVWTNP